MLFVSSMLLLHWFSTSTKDEALMVILKKLLIDKRFGAGVWQDVKILIESYIYISYCLLPESPEG